jgi:hypothetical protein
MTDRDLLVLLNDFYGAQKNIICFMLWAIEDYNRGKEVASWDYLFNWAEAKDAREKLWKRFKSEYPRAMMLKEGVGYD